jgi:hypothetical protein
MNRIQPWRESDPEPILWTDDYASLWQALDRGQVESISQWFDQYVGRWLPGRKR